MLWEKCGINKYFADAFFKFHHHHFTRYYVMVRSGQFVLEPDLSFQLGVWFHSVVNYHGPSTGFTVHHDGMEVGQGDSLDTTKPKTDGETELYVGKLTYGGEWGTYGSVSMDEIKIYSRRITPF